MEGIGKWHYNSARPDRPALVCVGGGGVQFRREFLHNDSLRIKYENKIQRDTKIKINCNILVHEALLYNKILGQAEHRFIFSC